MPEEDSLSNEKLRRYEKVTIGFGQSGNENRCVISRIGSCKDGRGRILNKAHVVLPGARYGGNCFFKVNQIQKGKKFDFCTLNGNTGEEIKRYPFPKNVTRISVE